MGEWWNNGKDAHGRITYSMLSQEKYKQHSTYDSTMTETNLRFG